MLDRFKRNHLLWHASKIVVVIDKTLMTQCKPRRKQLTYEDAGHKLKKKISK